MKKIGLIALAAMVFAACPKKAQPVEASAPSIIDSLVLVEGAGDVVSDVYGNEIAAAEGVPAQNAKLMLHHQQTLTSGVYEFEVAVVNAETGETTTTVDTGTYVTVEGGEFPIIEMKNYTVGQPQYYAVKGDTLEFLDADRLPLATPYVLVRYALAPEAEVATEAAPAPAAE